jgi:hypothetical protein
MVRFIICGCVHRHYWSMARGMDFRSNWAWQASKSYEKRLRGHARASSEYRTICARIGRAHFKGMAAVVASFSLMSFSRTMTLRKSVTHYSLIRYAKHLKDGFVGGWTVHDAHFPNSTAF